ncbi:MAG: hypothetical protein R3B45_02505 [Bdellovibrionota bacterium]
MKRTRRIYWLVNELTPLIRGRAMLLNPHGFDVEFFTSLAEIRNALEKKRAGIVFIADDSTEYDNDLTIKSIAKMLELKGARLILTMQNKFPSNLSLAAACNFRDMIPLNLPDDYWIKRVTYSCASKAEPYIQPSAQVSMNNISALTLPCRIIWMSDTRIRLECRLRPPVGAKLKLGGAIAEELGVAHLNLTVQSCERSHLHYRFSDAIMAHWKIPKEAEARYQSIIWKLRAENSGPCYRAFIAAKSANLRNALFKNLAREEDFIISSALQIQSMVMEPKYFTPDIVFVEDALTMGSHSERFASMLGNLSPKVAVVIIGSNVNRDELRARHSNYRLLFLKNMPGNFDKSVLQRVLPSLSRGAPDVDIGATHFPDLDVLSFGQLQIPARLTQIHPKVVSVKIPFDIGCFGMIKLLSPVMKKVLGRDPWVKITATTKTYQEESAPFIFDSEGFLADVDANDLGRMAKEITNIVQSHFAKFISNDKSSLLFEEPSTRTPELGSLKSSFTQASSRYGYANYAKKEVPLKNIQVKQNTNIASLDQPENVKPPAFSYDLNAFDLEIKEIDLSEDELASIHDLEIVNDGRIEENNLREVKIDRGDYQEFGDKAKDIVQGVYDGIKSKSFRRVIFAVAFMAFMIAMILGVVYSLSSRYDHGGKVFTDSLYQFAPHLQKGSGNDNSNSGGDTGRKLERKAPTPFFRPQNSKDR